jgi:opacity protein-like surface antigen
MTTQTFAASAILLSAIPAIAGTTAPSLTNTGQLATTTPSWHCRVALYGWATALDGDVTIRGNSVPVDASFSDILDKLDFAAMGAVEVGCGKWSLLADLFYAQLSGSNSRKDVYFESQLSQFIGNFVVAYHVIDTTATRLDVYAGARVNSLDADLDINPRRIGAIHRSASKTWVDPIIGVRFQQDLSNKFFLRMVGDIGGFGVSSDFTWQTMAALGYRTNDNGSVLLGYRGIGTDYSDGNFGYDVISHGLMLGFEYKF